MWLLWISAALSSQRGGVADAFEARAGGGHVGAQHLLGAGAERQVDEADDARRHPRRAVAAARRHGGDAVDELGLAERAQLRRTVGAVAGRALDEDGRSRFCGRCRYRPAGRAAGSDASGKSQR